MNLKLKNIFSSFLLVLMLLLIPTQVFAQEFKDIENINTIKSNIIDKDAKTKPKNIGHLPKVIDGDDGYTVPNYEIVPSTPMELSEYQSLLNQISTTRYYLSDR